MAQAKKGDTVKVHYTGKLNDDTVFDTSDGSQPLQFTIGEGKLIKDFEQAVVGMNPGESRTIQISSDRAYGPHLAERVTEVDRQEFPQDLNPQVNQMFQVHQPDGNMFVATVTAVSESKITLDANHPLAGKDLIFSIQLAEII
ncbi:MAG: peptidylprolyl isomerase [Chloroflexi bacterium RBG_16_50_9]|nr:MAG: peptidylprolyl isomerase [Chloroflexi bacterium RBG_16_50_9]